MFAQAYYTQPSRTRQTARKSTGSFPRARRHTVLTDLHGIDPPPPPPTSFAPKTHRVRQTARKTTGRTPPLAALRALPTCAPRPRDLVDLEKHEEEDGGSTESGAAVRVPKGMPVPMIEHWVRDHAEQGRRDLQEQSQHQEEGYGEGVEDVTMSLEGSSSAKPAPAPVKPASQVVSGPEGLCPTKPSGHVILELIRLQEYDGSFPVVHAIARIFGTNTLVNAAIAYDDQKIGVTGLVVAYLQEHLSDQNLLHALMDEARGFVEKQGPLRRSRKLEEVVTEMRAHIRTT